MKKLKSHDKFEMDKTYRYFPGIAIIKPFDEASLVSLLIRIRESMKASGCFDKYVFLPASSYHMTVCDIITVKDLRTNPMFSDFELKNETDLSTIDNYVYDQLKGEEYFLDVKMKAVRITAKKIVLEPKTKTDKETLNAFRKKVYRSLNIEMEENYQFHISLAYRLNRLTQEELNSRNTTLKRINQTFISEFGDVTIDSAHLVAFNDMSCFRRISEGRANLGNYCETEMVSDNT